MKAMVKVLLVVIMALSMPTAALAIGISFNATSGEVLEDCALWATMDGGPTRYVVPLGDFDLSSVTEAVVDVPVGDGTSTHWWLIGHMGANIVYSSTQNLTGVGVLSIEPFSSGDQFTVGDTITQLEIFNSTGSFTSLDILGLLAGGHTSHVTADGNASDLWLFASPGSSIGQIALGMHTNTPPGFGPAPVPLPTTILLLGSGLIRMAWLRRKFKP